MLFLFLKDAFVPFVQSHTKVCSLFPQQNLLKNNFVLYVH